MRSSIVLALVAVVGLAASANAATIKASVVLNPAVPGCVGCTLSGVGTYDLYLQDVSGSPFVTDHVPAFGIASYGITLLNVNDVQHRSPRMTSAVVNPADPDEVPDLAGFTNLRSGANLVVVGGTCPGPACGGFQIGASQDVITPTTHLIYGYGQTASSFAALGLTQSGGALTQPSWGAKLLIAEGHWTPNNANRVPKIDISASSSSVVVYASQSGSQVKAAALIPEPASIALAGLAALGLLGVVRRRK